MPAIKIAKNEKEAMHYEQLPGGKVRCRLCPYNCLITDGKRGFCGVRQNIKGVLYSLVYEKPISIAVDPIEKKPLYHFYPGSTALSFGTAGCNLKCLHCQNYEISQADPAELDVEERAPKWIISQAIKSGCKSIAYTYTEPTILFEYVLETAKLAKKAGLKNVSVTNGYINKAPLHELYKHIDAANVDLKGFTTKFYGDVCKAKLEPVLDTLVELKKMDVWLEITNLIIPKLNDDMEKIKEMCLWIKDNLGVEYPLHFSAFYPCYKLGSYPPTPKETLDEAKKVADKVGLKHVYTGNVMNKEGNNTYCSKCGNLLIKRGFMFDVRQNYLESGRCPKCSKQLNGIF